MPRKPSLPFWSFALMTGLAGTLTAFNVKETYSATPPEGENSALYGELDLFGQVVEVVRASYVDRPEDKKLITEAIKGMVASLDPHSAYYDSKQFRDMQEETKGEFGGLGLEVEMESGLVKVVSPIDGSPAAKAGLLANDLITRIDDQEIMGLTLQQAVERMRGPVSTPIVLTVQRKGQDKPFIVTVVRDIIRVNPVKARAEGDVAYVKIATFSEQTHDGLVKAVETLKRQIGPRLKGYIIDLRNDPGGLLDQAIAVADDFLEQGVIVLTKGRKGDDIQRAQARPGDITAGKKIVVLINGGSASASEIVAGALQDQQRATVIGTRSFGKGSVQTIMPLGGDNGALRLTTARYYTPSNRSIQAEGIVPDIEVAEELPPELQSREKEVFMGEASLRGHLLNPHDGDKKEKKGSSAYVAKEPLKDTQLQYALSYLRGGATTASRASPAAPAQPARKPD